MYSYPVKASRTLCSREGLIELISVEGAEEEDDCSEHLGERDHCVDALE